MLRGHNITPASEANAESQPRSNLEHVEHTNLISMAMTDGVKIRGKIA